MKNELIKSNFELTNCRNAVFSNVKKNETSFIFAAIEPSYYRNVLFFIFLIPDANSDDKKRIKNDHRENARKDAYCNLSCEFIRNWIQSP